MKFSTAFTFLAAAAAVATTTTTLVSAQDQTIVEVAQSTGNHDTLVALATAAGLAEALSTTPEESDGWTVFAPTDDAFGAVDADTITRLSDPAYVHHLQDILFYHVVSTPVASSDLSQDQEVTMYNDEIATITSLEPPTINTAVISTPDVAASNGVVHVTDGALVPASITNSVVDAAVATESLSTLVDLVTAANLVETLSGPGPCTFVSFRFVFSCVMMLRYVVINSVLLLFLFCRSSPNLPPPLF